MQTPGRASLGGDRIYSDAAVLAQMNAPLSIETWVVDLLSADGDYVEDLTPSVSLSSASIQHDTTRAVQRTFTFTLNGPEPLEQLRCLVRPRYLLRMPDGDWISFALGLFSLLPSGNTISRGHSARQYLAADSSQLLTNAAITYAASVRAGTNYIQAITGLVETYGGPTPIPVAIPDTGKTLPGALGWDAGTSRLTIVNALLAAMNYYPAWFDEQGVMRSSPIPDYASSVPTATIDTDSSAVIGQLTSTPDFSKVYNQFLLKGTDPRKVAFSAYYENDDPASPISTVNWYPKLLSWSDSAITDAGTAYQACRTAAQVAERIYAPIALSTTTWPLSQSNDIYTLHLHAADEPELTYPCIETAWSANCISGGLTQHTLERLS